MPAFGLDATPPPTTTTATTTTTTTGNDNSVHIGACQRCATLLSSPADLPHAALCAACEFSADLDGALSGLVRVFVVVVVWFVIFCF
jgi:hypothetical protein